VLFKLSKTEKIVYRDSDFIIVRYEGFKTKFVYEVIHVVKNTTKRLNDIQICPEPCTLKGAKKLMKQYKKGIKRIFISGLTVAYVKEEDNTYIVYHFFDNILQYKYSYSVLKHAIEDLKCLESEFIGD